MEANKGLTDDRWITPRQAALITSLSQGYLRTSDCPKTLLPVTPRGKKTTKPRHKVLYHLGELKEWFEKHTVRRNSMKRAS